LKLEADSSNSSYPLETIAVKLFAQIRDVGIDHGTFGFKGDSPYLIEEICLA
jgi:hypothetical protein